jgi:hypothetical protein
MALTINTSEQTTSSYTWTFNVTSDVDNTKPLTIEIYTEEDGDLIYTFENVEQSTDYSYDFGKAGDFYITYIVTIDAFTSDSDVEEIEVLEWKPTFTLPVVTCKEYKQESIFGPTALSLNNNVCPVSPETEEIEYKLYEFNITTGAYVLVDTEVITIDPEDVDLETLQYTWTPTKLTKVKLVVKVTNCSVSTTKEVEFFICGVWKIRRISCGNYRLYNYLSEPLTYTITNSLEETISSGTVEAFNFVELGPLVDDIYKVNAQETTAYIINFCQIDECILELQKNILLDNICDDCKKDKNLQDLTLRILPVYETWKKLLDKDGVYEIQYASTDINGELARIYDAQELYLELKNLCHGCNSKKSGCGC